LHLLELDSINAVLVVLGVLISVFWVKAMDADKDGTLTLLEEMLDLMRGISKSAPQH
jgi:hypothetical protein